MKRTYNENVAKQIAKEKNLSYGFCVLDGRYYVGTIEQLTTLHCLYINQPN